MSDKLPVNDYRLFPDVGVERGVDYRHYESLQPPGKILRKSPSIQSDIIRDPFVRLFIPYSPRYNSDLAEHCPDVEPIPKEGYFGDARPSEKIVGSALDCLGSYHLVFLNGKRLDLEFDFFTRAETGVRGIVTYIPTERLPRGRNALRIERVAVEEEEQEDKTEYFIPFWI